MTQSLNTEYIKQLWQADEKTINPPTALSAIIPFFDDIGSDPSGENLDYDRVEMAGMLRVIADDAIRMADEVIAEALRLKIESEGRSKAFDDEMAKYQEWYRKKQQEMRDRMPDEELTK